jgi:hypothetical protein
MKIIGDKNKVAFEIGEFWQGSKQNQHINYWVGGKKITCFDDVIYLPTFYTALEGEIHMLENEDFVIGNSANLSDEELFRKLDAADDQLNDVLNYDITVCPATCYLVRLNNKHKIIYSFWDDRHAEVNRIFSIEIDKQYLIQILKETLNELSSTWI